LRKRWAILRLLASFGGVILQDLELFVLSDAAKQAGPRRMVMQGLVLLVAIGLMLLGRRAAARGWIGPPAASQN
jgi:hypothetical protein